MSTTTPGPPAGSDASSRHAQFPFADYLEDVPVERQGQQIPGQLTIDGEEIPGA